MKIRRPLAALAVLLAPAVVSAPPPEPHTPGLRVDDLVQACRTSGLTGWDLVDEATRRVHEQYTHHSLRHLWESPGTSLAHGHGWSAQYNGALAEVLAALGFTVRQVHAARVRGLGDHPWWHAGHTWLQVTHDQRTLDVCAAQATHRAGQLGFVAMTPVREVNPWTRALVSSALTPLVAVQAWRQLAGAPASRWFYRPFGQRP